MKCLICDKQTDTGFSIDLDVPKIPYCPDHKEELFIYLTLATNESGITSEQFLKNARKRYLKKYPKATTGKGKSVDPGK